MRKLLFLLVVIALAACGADAPSAGERASQAAKAYYDELLAGHYDQFLDARAGIEGIPAGYREQLLAGLRQFMAQQQDAHQGIQSVEVSTTTQPCLDSTLNVMQVFLMLSYGDSTHEEIVVPMIEQNGEWKMR